MSPQVISGRDDISSKIRRRVLSASALDIFSICCRFRDFPDSRALPPRLGRKACRVIIPKINASFHLDVHLSVEVARKPCAQPPGRFSPILRRIP